MTPPPLPDGCSGWSVDPDIHTGQPEPDRDGWTDADEEREDLVAEILQLTALMDDVVFVLRELECRCDEDTRHEIATLLDKIGAAR